MSLVLTSDFVGEYKLSQSRFTELDTYILKYEKYYLLRMLGNDLYNLFIADLNGATPQVPQSARFLAIYNPFNTIPSCDSLVISEGMKVMLIQFIYFHYLRDSNHFNTIAGQVTNNTENSNNTPYQGNLIEVYNSGVVNYSNIQQKIEEDLVTYPETLGSYAEFLCYASGI